MDLMPQTPPQTLDAKLEQTGGLEHSETIASPLLFTHPDGAQSNSTQSFVHDTYRDFFIAKYFADEINEGKMSLEHAYTHFWSYEEDAELWELDKNKEWRALLPSWKNALIFLFGFLDNSSTKQLTRILNANYALAKKDCKHKKYNPFSADHIFSRKLAVSKATFRKKITKRLVTKFINVKDKAHKLEYLKEIERLNVYDARLLALIKDEDMGEEVANAITQMSAYDHVLGEIYNLYPSRLSRAMLIRRIRSSKKFISSVMSCLKKDGAFGFSMALNFIQPPYPELDDLFNDPNTEVRCAVLKSLAKHKYYDSKILSLLTDAEEKVREAAFEAIGACGFLDTNILKLLYDENPINRYNGVICLGKLHHFDSNLLKQLDDNVPYIVTSTIWALGETKEKKQEIITRLIPFLWCDNEEQIMHTLYALGKLSYYDEQMIQLLRHSSPEIKKAAAWAMGESKHYEPELGALLNDEDVNIKAAAISAIGDTGVYHPDLLAFLKDSQLKDVAIKAIEKIDYCDKRLIELLTTHDDDLITSAVILIGSLGFFDERLMELLHSQDQKTANAAEEALQRIYICHSEYLKDTQVINELIERRIIRSESEELAFLIDSLVNDKLGMELVYLELIVARAPPPSKWVHLFKDQRSRAREMAVYLAEMTSYCAPELTDLIIDNEANVRNAAFYPLRNMVSSGRGLEIKHVYTILKKLVVHEKSNKDKSNFENISFFHEYLKPKSYAPQERKLKREI